MDEEVKVVKTAARKFKVLSIDGDGNEVRKATAPAEYAVRRGDETLAVIVKAGDGWRCCKPSTASRIGLAISPIGLDTWGAVKVWALEEFDN